MTTATASGFSSAAWKPLGADDLRILQGLVAMAGPNGPALGPEPKTEGGRQLRPLLPNGRPSPLMPWWSKVAIGRWQRKSEKVDSGGAQHIQDCIERLWKVSIIAQNGRKRQGFRLLSEYASDEADGRLYVA